MTSETLARKLTTIVYADVADYSKLSGIDEEGTHHRVMEMLDHASRAISTSGGNVLRYAGDAILAEFPSVVSAVTTMIEIQSKFAQNNASVTNDLKVHIRIGINIGDVIEDRGEVFGDGVNLAARLEAAAPAGGICISSAVHDQIVEKIDFTFRDDGPEQFKNIAKPVHVFRLSAESILGSDDLVQQQSTNSSDKPSIAVLAFTNMNRDPELDFIGDGLTEDLITALSKIRSFKVISRESTFSYKGTAIDVRQVAKELNVRYVLEGSVRKAGTRVRVTAQLIDALTGHHVWAERYDQELENIFDLQDQMTQTIAGALEPELNAVERERAVLKSPDNLDAWEMYQRALFQMYTFEKQSVITAIDLFKKTNLADPKFAPAYAYLAYSYYIMVIMGYTDDPSGRLNDGLAAAKIAMKCDDKDAIPYFASGRIHMMLGHHDVAITSLEKSIELNPCYAQSYHGLGFALALAGRLEESKLTTQKAIDISPRDPLIWAFMIVHALTCVLNGDNEDGLAMARQAIQVPQSAGYWCSAVIAAALANLGHISEAQQSLADALLAKPDLTVAFLIDNMPTKHPDGLEPYLTGLRIAGLRES